MSRPDSLPPTARAIALLIASTPGVHDAQPGVLHQLLEFSHRYASQVLSDAQAYSEHAGRNGKIDMEDVTLAVQARVGWEYGGRVPKEYLLSLATQTNSVPLPPVPEVFGVRLPPAGECLTSVDFDLVPNKPPPEVKLFDEEIEEIEEEDEEEEEDQYMDVAPPPMQSRTASLDSAMHDGTAGPQHAPISALHSPSDVDMLGTPAPADGAEGSEEEDDGLFAGGEDDDGSGDDNAEATTGVKRKLVEEDDYD